MNFGLIMDSNVLGDFNIIAPNHLIQYCENGMNARNVYQISLGNALKKDEKVQVCWEEDLFRVVYKSYDMRIELTDFYEHVYVKGKYYQTKKWLSRNC